jgi:RNA polymerase primary sigma factor
MSRAIDLASAVRVSGRAREKSRNLRKLLAGWESAIGPGDRLAEAARRLGTDAVDAGMLLVHGESVGLDGEDDQPLQLTAEGIPADEVAATREGLRAIDRLLPTLDPAVRAVLVGRFGLDGEEPRSIRQLAASLGIPTARVRSLEAQGLDRLRGRGRA